MKWYFKKKCDECTVNKSKKLKRKKWRSAVNELITTISVNQDINPYTTSLNFLVESWLLNNRSPKPYINMHLSHLPFPINAHFPELQQRHTISNTSTPPNSIEEKPNKESSWHRLESISHEREKRLLVAESKKKKNSKYSEWDRGGKRERKLSRGNTRSSPGNMWSIDLKFPASILSLSPLWALKLSFLQITKDDCVVQCCSTDIECLFAISLQCSCFDMLHGFLLSQFDVAGIAASFLCLSSLDVPVKIRWKTVVVSRRTLYPQSISVRIKSITFSEILKILQSDKISDIHTWLNIYGKICSVWLSKLLKLIIYLCFLTFHENMKLQIKNLKFLHFTQFIFCEDIMIIVLYYLNKSITPNGMYLEFFLRDGAMINLNFDYSLYFCIFIFILILLHFQLTLYIFFDLVLLQIDLYSSETFANSWSKWIVEEGLESLYHD